MDKITELVRDENAKELGHQLRLAEARIEELEKRVKAAQRTGSSTAAALASAAQTLSNVAHGDATGDVKSILLNAAANARHAVAQFKAALGGEE